MKYFPQKYWYLVKFENGTKWFYSRNSRKVETVINYWRRKNTFKWCKVFNPKTKKEVFWFNQNNFGTTDSRTVNKNSKKK